MSKFQKNEVLISPGATGIQSDAPWRGAITSGSCRIYIIDNDFNILILMREILESHQYDVVTFSSCEDFLREYKEDGENCLVLDLQLPGIGGIDLLRRLSTFPYAPPTIVVSGSSGIAEAVQSMKLGALDFMEKPVQAETLLEGVRRALQRSRRRIEETRPQMEAVDQLATLTRRQRQVMDLVLAGRRNKQIAADLGVSQRTVENHRAAIMAKLGAKSIPALSLTAFSALASG